MTELAENNFSYVMLKKISSVPDAYSPTPNGEEYRYGKLNPGASVPVEYTVTGYIGHKIELDRPLVIMRDTRNGIECHGVMTTSAVKFFTANSNGFTIKTLNSVYELTWIKEQ